MFEESQFIFILLLISDFNFGPILITKDNDFALAKEKYFKCFNKTSLMRPGSIEMFWRLLFNQTSYIPVQYGGLSLLRPGFESRPGRLTPLATLYMVSTSNLRSREMDNELINISPYQMFLLHIRSSKTKSQWINLNNSQKIHI